MTASGNSCTTSSGLIAGTTGNSSERHSRGGVFPSDPSATQTIRPKWSQLVAARTARSCEVLDLVADRVRATQPIRELVRRRTAESCELLRRTRGER